MARWIWGMGLVVAGLASAAAAQPVKTALGAGETLCGTWVASVEKPDHFGQLQWVLGSVTRGAFSREGHVLSLRSPADIESWMNSYCKAHGLDTLQTAAYNLELDMKWQARKIAPRQDDLEAPPR